MENLCACAQPAFNIFRFSDSGYTNAVPQTLTHNAVADALFDENLCLEKDKTPRVKKKYTYNTVIVYISEDENTPCETLEKDKS